jgi:5'-deoxynucleotidase YfbR-like HD superfamily hydrolase
LRFDIGSTILATMDEKIQKLAEIVKNSCSRQDFEYRDWFYDFHLTKVSELALLFAEIYAEVDADTVRVLALVHDFSKPFCSSKEDEKEQLLPMIQKQLLNLKFEQQFIEKIISVIREVESKDTLDMSTASIEAKIVSSSDGASHFFAPFFYSYFRNDKDEYIRDTMRRVVAKARRDWERKIVLPEAKELVRSRYELLLSDMVVD